MKKVNGYRVVLMKEHPNANPWGYVYEHVLVASRALGKALPPGADVHHVNGVKTDNRPCNLVVCQDRAYHMLLHARLRAFEACGNPNWRKCHLCSEWTDTSEMIVRRNSGAVHRRCHNAVRRVRYAEKRGGRVRPSRGGWPRVKS